MQILWNQCIMRGEGWIHQMLLANWREPATSALFSWNRELPSNRFVRRGVLLLLILNDVINLKISKSPGYIVQWLSYKLFSCEKSTLHFPWSDGGLAVLHAPRNFPDFLFSVVTLMPGTCFHAKFCVPSVRGASGILCRRERRAVCLNRYSFQ